MEGTRCPARRGQTRRGQWAAQHIHERLAVPTFMHMQWTTCDMKHTCVEWRHRPMRPCGASTQG
eukprot:366074-Chlamydomonas_euryale.AAC.8